MDQFTGRMTQESYTWTSERDHTRLWELQHVVSVWLESPINQEFLIWFIIEPESPYIEDSGYIPNNNVHI